MEDSYETTLGSYCRDIVVEADDPGQCHTTPSIFPERQLKAWRLRQMGYSNYK